MSTLSNSQGLMFAEVITEAAKDPNDTSVKGWFSTQQAGAARATITDAVRAAKGVVTHTIGQAVLSSFPDAVSAMKAAIDLQKRLAKDGKNPVKVRAGLAFGPVRVVAGKVSGDAVAAAGTLLEKARPGEILIDQAMKSALGRFDYVTLTPHGSFDGLTAYRARGAGAASPDFADTERFEPQADLTIVTGSPALRKPAGGIVLRYGKSERRFTPADGEVTLGRASENDINVPAGQVSRRHAKIIWEGKVPVLVNLSPNGSCVRFDEGGRQQPCEDPVPLTGSGLIILAAQAGQFASRPDAVQFRID